MLCLQATQRSRLAPTSTAWLHTCSKSGTMQPTLTWAAASSHPIAAGRPGGGAACARPGSRTGGRQQSATAQMAPAVPTIAGEPCAPATTWPTTTQRWQRSGTGRPTGKGHQRLSLPAATPKQPGGVASVGSDGAPLWPAEQESVPADAPSVPMRPAVSRQGSPASAMEHHTCWLTGTGKPTRHMAGTQTMLFWAQISRCSGSC